MLPILSSTLLWACYVLQILWLITIVPVADLEIQNGGVQPLANFWVATPTFGHAGSPNWTELNTLGLVKCLEITKELIRECVTMPGCCCCMPLLHNHLMDSCSYVYAKIHYSPPKGGAFAPPLPPLNPPLCTIGTILYPRVISHKSVEYIRWTHNSMTIHL